MYLTKIINKTKYTSKRLIVFVYFKLRELIAIRNTVGIANGVQALLFIQQAFPFITSVSFFEICLNRWHRYVCSVLCTILS